MNNIQPLINGRDSFSKTQLKWVEVPIQKFNAAVPHFVELVKHHNINIAKLKRLNQTEDLRKEITTASRTIDQLKSLINEMDNLRTEVVECDLSKFDKSISNSKQQALSVMQTFQDNIPDESFMARRPFHEEPNDEQSNFQDEKLQVVANLSEEVRKQEQIALAMDRLREDVQDVHSIFNDLSQLVNEQGESVERIENNVEVTHVNVVEGEKMLCQAVKYKQGMYPMIGALLGSVLGGPVGLLAGMKLGTLTAVACGMLGFTGGKILKNQNETTITEANENRKNVTT